MPAEWLAHTSPVSWEHISLSGDFLWDRAAATASGRRPLNLIPARSPPEAFVFRSSLALFI